MASETGSEGTEEGLAFLQLENAFLLKLLQRVSPQVLEAPGGGSAAAPRGACASAAFAAAGGNPLLLAEKQELCAVEANVTRWETEAVRRAGELELACTLAATADFRLQQAAETSRDLAALLTLLGLPAESAVGSGSPAASAAAVMPAISVEQTDALSAEGATAAGAEPDGDAAHAGLPLRLPTAKQLARAGLSGARLGQFLEGILERHDVAAARLQMRTAMLKPQLGRVEGQLAAKAEVGDTLKKVDFDQLRIQHSQAEAALAAASAEAIALKAQVARAAQHLADQRGALAASAAASEQLRHDSREKEGQAAQLEADAGKVERECGLLERECQRLREGGAGRARQQGGQPGGGKGTHAAAAAAVGAPVVTEAQVGEVTMVLDYMRVKSACAEASKKIADWQRKLEVQAGQQRRAR